MKTTFLSVSGFAAVALLLAACGEPGTESTSASATTAAVSNTTSLVTAPTTYDPTAPARERTTADPAAFQELFDTWVASGIPVLVWASDVCEGFDRKGSKTAVEAAVNRELQKYPSPGTSRSWDPMESKFFTGLSVKNFCPEYVPLVQN